MLLNARDKLAARLKRFVALYARMLNKGEGIDWIKLGKIYNSKDKIPAAKARQLLSVKGVSQMVTDELIKLYEKENVTPEKVIKDRKKVLKIAFQRNDLTNANKVLDSFENNLAMHPDKQITTQMQEISYVELLEGQGTKGLKPEPKKIEDKKPKNE